MTPWDSFIARRKIDTASFLAHNGLDTREKFLSHLREMGVAPPSDDVTNSLFPAPKVLEVKVETAKSEQEGISEEGASSSRSNLHKRDRAGGASSRTVSTENRSNKNT